ncbi:MAG TPA: cupin domain-containing protein [Xanthobacteraceae bacterium]|jgi:uncharacterized protein YjlB
MDFEAVKKFAERATGLGTPAEDELLKLVRESEVTAFRFKDDGFIPNHPNWPFLLYPACVRLPKGSDPAAVFETLFTSNGWGRAWRNGVYDFVHYHSRTHEVLAVARGYARVQFGGPKGRIIRVKAGDAALLPAGTGHQCIEASDNFLAVGAYPPDGVYDECKNVEDRKEAKKSILKTARPSLDPVYGEEGPLHRHWRQPQRKR